MFIHITLVRSKFSSGTLPIMHSIYPYADKYQELNFFANSCIMCLLTELGRAGRENIWLEVMPYGPSVARSVRHDRKPNIFPSGPT